MKKTILSRLLKFIALLLPIAIMVLFSQNFLFYFGDNSTERIRNFYDEPQNSLDVVFIGASEVYNGYSPAYAYDRYGFTSYMYAIGANPGLLYKAELTEVMSSQNPQLLFVEIYGFLLPEVDQWYNEPRFRIFIDNIPMSKNKVDCIIDFPCEDRLSCFLPFTMYHGDWMHTGLIMSNLEQRLSSWNQPDILRGVVTSTHTYDGIFEKEYTDYRLDDDTLALSEKHLLEFIEHCKQYNLRNVVFVDFPRFYTEQELADRAPYVANIKEIVNEHGYSFLDLQGDVSKIGLDYQQDFYDSEHLNIYGQIKLTDYIGKLVMTQYHLAPMDLPPACEKSWNESAIYIREYYSLLEQGDL